MNEIYPLLFPATFLLLVIIERFVPGRPQPPVRRWALKGIAFFMLGGLINSTLPPALGAAVAGHTLLDLTGLGSIGGAIIGLLAATFLSYWLHRLFHRVTWLWRWTHQMHHSAERVDMIGFAYSHPFELMLATTTTPIVSLLIGVTPAAAMIAGYLGFVIALFEHFNTFTPTWLGYILQRPEMHSVHHQRDVHAYNYGLPIWDLMFGTFRNPATWDAKAGFWDGASKRVFPMLLGRDVAQPR